MIKFISFIKKNLGYLFLILIVFYLAITKSINGDEVATLSLVTENTYRQLLMGKPGEYNPPLYYIIVKFLFNLFGNNNLSLRLASILFLIFTYIAYVKINLYIKFKIKVNEIYIQYFLITSPLILFYSYQARAYTALLFYSVILTLLTIKIIESNNKSTKIFNFLYIIFLVLGMYSHYFVSISALIILVSIPIFINNYIYRKKILFKFIILNFIGFLLFLPEVSNAFINYKSVSNIQTIQSEFNILYRMGFVLFGLLFGEAFKPDNLFLIVVAVTYSCFIFYNIVENLKNKIIIKILLIILFIIFLISSLPVARSMYGIMLILIFPYFINTIIVKKSVKLIYTFFIINGFIFLITFYNIITNNGNLYFMPAYSIEYNKTFKEINNIEKNKNINFLITPSWNNALLKYYLPNKNISYIAIDYKGNISNKGFFNLCSDKYFIISENIKIINDYIQLLNCKNLNIIKIEENMYRKFLSNKEDIFYNFSKVNYEN
jgi:hypothetical protein